MKNYLEFNKFRILTFGFILIQMLSSIIAMENFYRFSDMYKRTSQINDLSMNAVLLECPTDTNEKYYEKFNCEEKILVTIRMKRPQKVCESRAEKILLLDEVFDASSKSRAKLMSPYLIQIVEGDPMVMYPLQFVDTLACPNCSNNNLNEVAEVYSKNKNTHKKIESRLKSDSNLFSDHNHMFNELDAKNQLIQNKVADYIKTELNDNVNDLRTETNRFKPRELLSQVSLNQDNKQTCHCKNCADCAQLQGESKCNCCKTCLNSFSVNNQANIEACSCPECQNVESTLKCDCCNSLNSCQNSICSYNDNSFRCVNGICLDLNSDTNHNQYYSKDNDFNSMKSSSKENNLENADTNNWNRIRNSVLLKSNMIHAKNNYNNLHFNNINNENNWKNSRDSTQSIENNSNDNDNDNDKDNDDEQNINENFGDIRKRNFFYHFKKENHKKNELNKESKDSDRNDNSYNYIGKTENNVKSMKISERNENENEPKKSDDRIKEEKTEELNNVDDAIQNNFKSDKDFGTRKEEINEKLNEKYSDSDKKSKFINKSALNHKKQIRPSSHNVPNVVQQNPDAIGSYPNIFKKTKSGRNVDDSYNFYNENDRSVVKDNNHSPNSKPVPFEGVINDHSISNSDKYKLLDLIDNNKNMDKDLENLFNLNDDHIITIPKMQEENKYHNIPRPCDHNLGVRSMNEAANKDYQRKFMKRSLNNYDDYSSLFNNIENDFDDNFYEKFKTNNDDSDDANLTPEVNFNYNSDEEPDGELINQDSLQDDYDSNTFNDFDDLNTNEENSPMDYLMDNNFRNDDDGEDDVQRKRSVENIWFSVFNMTAPLQFLTTKILIFRKHENMWQKIVPPLHLTSSSGIYASNNLSILFSFHSDIINLEKPLNHRRYKLLIPQIIDTALQQNKTMAQNNFNQPTEVNKITEEENDEEEENIDDENKFSNNFEHKRAENYLTIDTSKIPITDKNSIKENSVKICEAKKIIDNLKNEPNMIRRNRRENEIGVHSLFDDVAKFSDHIQIVENCGKNSNEKCLNIEQNEIPAHKISFNIPFLENAIINDMEDIVKITTIIVDATSSSLIAISIHATNYGFKAETFKISVKNCVPFAEIDDYTKSKILLPHKGGKVCIKIPTQLVLKHRTQKKKCLVTVESPSSKIVTKRSILIQHHSRCFCIWNCACVCFGALAETGAKLTCTTISDEEEISAGFTESIEDVETRTIFNWNAILFICFLILFLIILIGCLKACFGLCSKKIGKWKYNYLQPMHDYEESSCFRRFFINSIFFLVFPFVCCCKCFTAKPDDLQSLPSSTWNKTIIQTEFEIGQDDDDDDDELTKLLEESEKVSESYEKIQKQSKSGESDTYPFSSYNDEDEENDTSFVLTALTESRESLKMLVSKSKHTIL